MKLLSRLITRALLLLSFVLFAEPVLAQQAPIKIGFGMALRAGWLAAVRRRCSPIRSGRKILTRAEVFSAVRSSSSKKKNNQSRDGARHLLKATDIDKVE